MLLLQGGEDMKMPTQRNGRGAMGMDGVGMVASGVWLPVVSPGLSILLLSASVSFFFCTYFYTLFFSFLRAPYLQAGHAWIQWTKGHTHLRVVPVLGWS